MKTTNKIGLEAEVFVYDGKNNLVFPSELGLPCDDFPLLGEIRGEPGETVAETVSNFVKKLIEFEEEVKERGMHLDYACDSRLVDHALYLRAIKAMGAKEFPSCKNIYNTDISEYPDTILNTDGKIVSHKVGCGLHVHFSSQAEDTKAVLLSGGKLYTPVKIPITFGDGIDASIALFKETGETKESTALVRVYLSRITKPVLVHIVKEMDKLFKSIKLEISTKYRQPGFYEIKPYGFEYRSLPFNSYTSDNITMITKTAFDLLEDLDLDS